MASQFKYIVAVQRGFNIESLQLLKHTKTLAAAKKHKKMLKLKNNPDGKSLFTFKVLEVIEDV